MKMGWCDGIFLLERGKLVLKHDAALQLHKLCIIYVRRYHLLNCLAIPRQFTRYCHWKKAGSILRRQNIDFVFLSSCANSWIFKLHSAEWYICRVEHYKAVFRHIAESQNFFCDPQKPGGEGGVMLCPLLNLNVYW